MGGCNPKIHTTLISFSYLSITMWRISSYSIGISLFLVAISLAGGPDSSNVYTLEGAVQTALRNNHDLTSARLEVQQASARVREAWGYAFPKIDLSARYTRALKKPVFYLPDFANPGSGRVSAIEIGSTHAFDMTVSAEQVLFNSSVFVGVGTARIYSKAAEQIYRAKRMETVTAAKKAFYGVLVAEEVLKMIEQSLTNAEENYQNTRHLAASGLVSEYDQLRAAVAMDNLRPELLKAENEYSLALNNLKSSIGASYISKLETNGVLEADTTVESQLESVVEGVITTNPSLAAMRYQAEVSDAVVSVERSSYLPRISAFGNYQYTSQNNVFNFSTGDFIASSQVGLSLSMNIFSGLQTNARVEQAELDLRKSQEAISGMEIRLQTSAESLVLQIRQAKQRIAAQGRTVEQAERGYRIASSRFANGLGIQLEVNDAQLALTRAKVNRIEAIYEHLIATVELDQLVGRLPEYVIEETD